MRRLQRKIFCYFVCRLSYIFDKIIFVLQEKCPWQCPHKKCTKRCREICDREPCDEPCREVLKCGHPCIGFCGEPCPIQCRICNREELVEEFYLHGTEGDEDSRFVFLPDCTHAIEVEGLTYYMDLMDDEIGIKRCPRCRTVITHCRRFNNSIKKRLKDVILVKKKIFGDQKKVGLTQDALIRKLRWAENLLRNFPTFHDYLLNLLCDKVPIPTDKGNHRMVPKKV
jgi:hypothetical protein